MATEQEKEEVQTTESPTGETVINLFGTQSDCLYTETYTKVETKYKRVERFQGFPPRAMERRGGGDRGRGCQEIVVVHRRV